MVQQVCLYLCGASLGLAPYHYPPPRLTSLPDLCSHKLQRILDARAVCDVEQHGLESGGGRGCQTLRTFLREARRNDTKTLSIQLTGQKVPEAAVTARYEHVLLGEIDLLLCKSL